MLASLDGTVMDAADVLIPATDEGLLRGDGVFEVIRLYAGRPFALDDHLARMRRSADNLRLAIDTDLVRADIEALLAEAGEPDAALRVLWTRGGRRLAFVEQLKELPPTLALAGVTFAPTRILDGVKSLSYAGNMLAGRVARERGADEALLVTPHGRVLEGPTCSFFCSLDGETLVTPPLEDHILDSITRRRLLGLTGAREAIVAADELARRARGVHGLDAARGPPGPRDRRGHAARGPRAAHRGRRGGHARARRAGARPARRAPVRVVTVIGNRPQFVKAAAVSRPLRAVHDELLVHTGQHYDDDLSTVFVQELGIPRPERELGLGTGTNTEQTARMLAALGPLLADARPDVVLVYGDTNSTLAGALAGGAGARYRSPTSRPACARSTGRCPRSSTACSPTTPPTSCCAPRRRRSRTSRARTSRAASSSWAT